MPTDEENISASADSVKAAFKLSLGDRVAYSVQFLRSIGMTHSHMAQARGKVTHIDDTFADFVLVTIDWENWGSEDGTSSKVNVKNLAKVGPNLRFCAA